jgi:hypothetical protein
LGCGVKWAASSDFVSLCLFAFIDIFNPMRQKRAILFHEFIIIIIVIVECDTEQVT